MLHPGVPAVEDEIPVCGFVNAAAIRSAVCSSKAPVMVTCLPVMPALTVGAETT